MSKPTLDPMKDIFVIPLSKNRYMVYAPKDRLIFSTDKESLPKLSALYKSLAEESKKKIKRKIRKTGRRKKTKISKLVGVTGVTLCPTTDCNLRCVYCYASGGERKKYMDWKLAKAAIDFALSRSKKSKRFSLGFHGGGEPFMAFDLMKKSVEYAKKRCKNHKMKMVLSSATNGVLTDKQLDWVIKNKMRLNVSIDGMPDIQNKLRPLPNKGESYPFVEKTIRRLVKEKVPFGVRSTITKDTVHKMKDIVEYFHKMGIKTIHFEPAFECGRCLKTKTATPEPLVFFKNYIKAFEAAEKFGIEFYYSGGTIDKLTDTFCGAAGRNFFVTSDGYITSCLEVMHKDDPASKIFFYGKYDERGGNFRIYEKRLKLLVSRNIKNLEGCQSCFCKFHCAGDCLVKAWRETGSLFETGTERCIVNRKAVKYVLLRYLKGKPIKMKNFGMARKVEIV